MILPKPMSLLSSVMVTKGPRNLMSFSMSSKVLLLAQSVWLNKCFSSKADGMTVVDTVIVLSNLVCPMLDKENTLF